ncbi:PAS domain S-box protein [Megalodesulfovibrio paquesii]
MTVSSSHQSFRWLRGLQHRQPEVWGTVLLCALICVAIFYLHKQQLDSLSRASLELKTLRIARVELARGMLAVHLANRNATSYQGELGVALLNQAMQGLRREDDPVLQRAVADFEDKLRQLTNATLPREASETGLRIAYHALDREAEYTDAQASQGIAALRSRTTREFWGALAVSAMLMAGVVGLAMLAGRARRQAEAARRDLARRHETTLRSIGDGVIVADASGRVELLNHQAEQLTGWADSEARGRPLAEVFHLVPEVQARWVGGNGQSEAAVVRERLAVQAMLLSKDGSRWPVEQTVAAIRNDAGRVTGSVLVFRDRTEERRFQQALAESEQHYRTLANSGSALIWTSDTDKLCNYFNEPWLRFTGRTLREELGYGWAEGVHPDDLQRCVDIYTQAFDRRDSFSMEYRLMHASGEYRWIVDTGAPRYSVHGEFLGYIGHCLDISERKQAEVDLRESEARFRTLADSAPEGIFIQLAGRFAYLNHAATRMLGAAAPEELLGTSVVDSFHPSCRPLVQERIRMLNEESRLAPPAEELLQRCDGTTLEVEVTAVPFALPGEQGGKGALVFFHEIGSLKRAAEEMRKAKEVAESANLAKSEFLANMSHEIRTPLNGVLGMLQLLGTTPLSQEQQEYVRTAIQASRRLTNLLSDLLDLSRIESGKLSLQEAEFDVAGVRESVLGLLSLTAQEKGLDLRFDCDPAMPDILMGDEARLRQILFNLVGNAIKFTDKGSVRVTMQPTPGRWAGTTRVLFTVEDTGIGISDSLLKTIFEPFSQAEAAYSRRFQGAGLGLAIVRKLVALLGGELCIDSSEQGGTMVYVLLPFKQVRSRALAPEESARQQASLIREQDDDAHGVRILFVEDDEVNSLAGVKLLEKLGYEATPAMNGQEALALLAAREFDLILMDVQMPVMDGIAATKAIRDPDVFGMKAAVPIIAMTAYAMTGDRDRFLAAGMDEYIAKPVEVNALVATMHRVLGRRPH